MKSKAIGIVIFCLVLFGAMLAGYWDMLNSERLDIVRDRAKQAVGQVSGLIGRKGTAEEPRPAPPGSATTAPASGVGAAKQAAETSKPAPKSNAAPISAPQAEIASASPAPTPDGTKAPAPASTEVPSGAAGTGSAPAASAKSPEDKAAGMAGRVVSPDASGQPHPAASQGSKDPLSIASAEPAPSPGSENSAAADAGGPQVPAFDVLRVEPSGEAVVAGRAPAGSDVWLEDGTERIGSDRSSAEGGFVIVPEKPLAVGDHQIRIVTKLPNGKTVASKETAVVSIPTRDHPESLLAMVETPDKPTRLIAVPKEAESAATATAAAPPAKPKTAPARPETEVAALPDAAAPPASKAPAASGNAVAKGSLVIEAVEIDNDKVFVAGTAPSGAQVRIYLDDRFLADDKSSAESRFLVTAKTNVPTGDHVVRADEIGAGGTVSARAEVPFFRPAGESMAAVAPSASAPAATAPSPAASSPRVAAKTERLPDSGSAGAPTDKTPNSSATDEAGKTDRVANAAPSEPSEAGLQPRVTETPPATAATDAKPSPDAVIAERSPAPPPATAGEDATTTAAASATPSKPDDAASAIPVTRQPALQEAGGRVIIRRGDTLWQISRETYGRGIRYTMIYLANGDQIRDPDRIYPGQVFRLPEMDQEKRAD